VGDGIHGTLGTETKNPNYVSLEKRSSFPDGKFKQIQHQKGEHENSVLGVKVEGKN